MCPREGAPCGDVLGGGGTTGALAVSSGALTPSLCPSGAAFPTLHCLLQPWPVSAPLLLARLCPACQGSPRWWHRCRHSGTAAGWWWCWAGRHSPGLVFWLWGGGLPELRPCRAPRFQPGLGAAVHGAAQTPLGVQDRCWSCWRRAPSHTLAGECRVPGQRPGCGRDAVLRQLWGGTCSHSSALIPPPALAEPGEAAGGSATAPSPSLASACHRSPPQKPDRG